MIVKQFGYILEHCMLILIISLIDKFYVKHIWISP